jgi:hypothetical protein
MTPSSISTLMANLTLAMRMFSTGLGRMKSNVN